MKKGKRGKPKLANCSSKDVIRTLKKLGDFLILEGTKHIKVIHKPTNKGSTLPRNSPINRHLLKDFVEDYLVKELGFLEEEIYKYLHC